MTRLRTLYVLWWATWGSALLWQSAAATAEQALGVPAQPAPFKHAGVTEVWRRYATRLTLSLIHI